MNFSPQNLALQLDKLPAARRYWIAFSGGLDSTALVHALSCLGLDRRQRVTAVHVNHNLHPQSASWVSHCESFCRQIDIPFLPLSVTVNDHRHLGIEGAARKARYDALSTLLEKQDVLLTAHHQDDQVETVCLQVFRGSGPSGLAGMPFFKPLGLGLHARPLLAFTRSNLCEYTRRLNLSWIEDPSNQSFQHDRNYLRNKLLPELRSRWPGIDRTVLRVARWQCENIKVQNDLATIDYKYCKTTASDQLEINSLRELEEHRQRNVLRYWILLNRFQVPGSRRLQSLLKQAVNSSIDSQLLIEWPQCEVRKYRQRLYIMQPLKAFSADAIQWRWQTPLQLDELGLELTAGQLIQQLGAPPDSHELTVCFRQGGEEVRLKGRYGTRKLKKVFQECSIPPWQRDRTPLIYDGNRLLLIWGCC